jgi:type IV pilus assembly protein PilF
MNAIYKLAVGAGLAASALWLAGCANPQAGAGTTTSAGGRTDIVTESDEPENRRRARIRLELASGYFEQGKTDIALDEIKQSLNADPNYADAYNLRGLIYMRLNDTAQAEDSFRRAVSLNPRESNSWHNMGWLQCQAGRYADANGSFERALSNSSYNAPAKTLMAQGVCQIRAGQKDTAERTLTRAYEIDAGNPIVAYNLANLLYQRGDYSRAQFYLRRLNNGEYANAETLWLGIKTERRLQSREAMAQLADQLRRRYSQSKELGLFERGAFDE